ncbi:MAG: hypothetical protein CL917_10335 [Deltaproteobacteria bacterium]|nr:hypothetical protein [Deltaproteobacteria bacterium]
MGSPCGPSSTFGFDQSVPHGKHRRKRKKRLKARDGDALKPDLTHHPSLQAGTPLSYQVIARKWRPQSFDEVTGQEHVTTPLRNAIRTGRVPHAILLTGPRGTGKTTLARIVALSLNCDSGPTETPCGQCHSCSEIAAGRSTDVQEIDAASRTGVDDVRQLNEAMRYHPTPGKHRIFVVDEVHMLSTAAFNALLKTLEEPPPDSLFVFATTNPEKLPTTVLSRCQRYDLRLFGISAVAHRLGEICKAEGISISETNLRILAREGRGSMRDSQTLLDQVISYGGTEISDEALATMLDLVDRRLLLEILTACLKGDAKSALLGCQRALQSGTEAKKLMDSLIQMLRDAVVVALAPNVEGLVEGGEGELEELQELSQHGGVQTLRRMFKLLIKEQEDLTWAPQPFAVLEMAVVRLASLPSGEDVAELIGRLKRLERQIASGGVGPKGGGPTPSSRSSQSPNAAPHRERPGASASSPTPPAVPAPKAPEATVAPEFKRPTSSPPPSSINETSVEPKPSQAAPHSSTPSASSAPPPRAGGLHDVPLATVMDRLKAFAQKEDRALFSSLDGARLLERSNGSLRIGIGNTFHRNRIESQLQALTETTERFFAEPMRLEIVADDRGPASAATPSPKGGKREHERKRRSEALNHPSINLGLEELRGEIVEIRPLGSE